MGIFNKKNEVLKPIKKEQGYLAEDKVDRTVNAPDIIKKTIIGRSLHINGEINASEEVIVNGKVEGKIKSEKRVIIDRKGYVLADVEADEVLIKGRVVGNVKGYTKVEVSVNGNLKGNNLSRGVVIAEGASFKGNIDMNLKK